MMQLRLELVRQTEQEQKSEEGCCGCFFYGKGCGSVEQACMSYGGMVWKWVRDEDKNCKTCKHLVVPNQHETHCQVLSDELDIDVRSGWDGHVIESVGPSEPEQFCCNKYERSEDN